MFLTRPSAADIDRFLHESQTLPLSYSPVGIVRERPAGFRFDQDAVVIGRGEEDFARARAALLAWKHFDIGWVEMFPPDAPVVVGTAIALLIRHFGLWSLNGLRIVYTVGGADSSDRVGFAYGTLTNHEESGEELFEVLFDPRNGDVTYRISAMSRPHTILARIGAPVARRLQARFRRDSAAALKRAVTRAVTPATERR
jgi:uncharacterized protein (UPF0548 family)